MLVAWIAQSFASQPEIFAQVLVDLRLLVMALIYLPSWTTTPYYVSSHPKHSKIYCHQFNVTLIFKSNIVHNVKLWTTTCSWTSISLILLSLPDSHSNPQVSKFLKMGTQFDKQLDIVPQMFIVDLLIGGSSEIYNQWKLNTSILYSGLYKHHKGNKQMWATMGLLY